MIETRIRRSARIDEAIHEATLPDGLPVRVLPRAGYQKRFAILATDYGSVDNAFTPPGEAAERAVPEGIAHFLEHKLFEDADGDAFDRFARFGASANAYTSFTETAYHFTTAAYFEECLDLLLDFVTTPYFTDEAIEKERKVIAQEIRMYEDAPDARAHLELMRCLYHRHPVRMDIPGTVESIGGIDRELLELCHRTFYRPENMVLVVAGDLDPAAVFDRAQAASERRAARQGALPQGDVRRAVVDEPAHIREASVTLRMPVSMPRALVGWKDAPRQPGPGLVRAQREIAFALELIFGRSSAFYEAHAATGLIDDTFSYRYHAGRSGFAYGIVGGDTPEPDRLVSALEEALSAARRDGLDREDFERLRNKAWGRFLRAFNSLEGTAHGECDAHLERWDLLTYLDMLEAITLDDVSARLDGLLDPAKRAVSLVMPRGA